MNTNNDLWYNLKDFMCFELFFFVVFFVYAALSCNRYIYHVEPVWISFYAVIKTSAHWKQEAPVCWNKDLLFVEMKSFIDPFFLSSSLHSLLLQNWLCCHTAMMDRMAPLENKRKLTDLQHKVMSQSRRSSRIKGEWLDRYCYCYC